MPKHFFTADWHFGDPRQESLLGRPFASSEDLYAHVLADINSVVAPEDTLYIVGDAFYKGGGADVSLLDAFNGHLVLIRGNHDVLPDSAYAPYVDEIIPEGEGIELDVEGIPCYLTHYPTRGHSDRFNLVGHIHGSWRVQKNMLNVGVDVQHFRVVTPERVRFSYDAICGFYDDDVWCSQLRANTAHAERGRKGSYFPPPRA